MQCPSCRSALPPGAAFCGTCGHNLSGAGNPARTASPGQVTVASKGRASGGSPNVFPPPAAPPAAAPVAAPPAVPPPTAPTAAARPVTLRPPPAAQSRAVTPSRVPSGAVARAQESQVSLAYVPPRGRSLGRVLVVLLVNAGFVAGGIYFLRKYLDARSQAAQPPRVAAAPSVHDGPEAATPVVTSKGLKIGKDQGAPVRPRVTETGGKVVAGTKVNGKPTTPVATIGTPPTIGTTSGGDPGTPPATGDPGTGTPPATGDPGTGTPPATDPNAGTGTPPATDPNAGTGGTATPPDPGTGDTVVSQATAADAEAVDHVVRLHTENITSCYQREQKKDPKIAGTLEIQFRVHSDGKARNAHVVSNDTGSSGLGSCIIDLLQSWEFPKPSAGEVEFIWPFAFQPTDQGP